MYSKKSGKLLLDRRFKAFRSLPKDDDTEANNAMLKGAKSLLKTFETDESLISFIEQVTNDINNSIILDESKRLHALREKADKSGVSYDVLLEVYQRGVDSYQESESITAEQWAFARVNSFMSGGKNTIEEDADLYEKRFAPFGALKFDILSRIRSKDYKAAMKDMIQSFNKDKGSHDISWYANKVAKIYRNVDGRQLEKMFSKEFPLKAESLDWGKDESVNTQKKATPGQSVSTKHSKIDVRSKTRLRYQRQRKKAHSLLSISVVSF